MWCCCPCERPWHGTFAQVLAMPTLVCSTKSHAQTLICITESSERLSTEHLSTVGARYANTKAQAEQHRLLFDDLMAAFVAQVGGTTTTRCS
jgi:hypothetical protein